MRLTLKTYSNDDENMYVILLLEGRVESMLEKGCFVGYCCEYVELVFEVVGCVFRTFLCGKCL